jgi:hypothetical protein
LNSKKKTGMQGMPVFFCLLRAVDQALMAFTGHVSTHAPQSMQVSASITRFSPCSLIALTGQESSHAPQLMHSSEIL